MPPLKALASTRSTRGVRAPCSAQGAREEQEKHRASLYLHRSQNGPPAVRTPPEHTQADQKSHGRKPRVHGLAGCPVRAHTLPLGGQAGPWGLAPGLRLPGGGGLQGRWGLPQASQVQRLEGSCLTSPRGEGGPAGLLQPGHRWGQDGALAVTGPDDRTGSGRRPRWPTAPAV